MPLKQKIKQLLSKAVEYLKAFYKKSPAVFISAAAGMFIAGLLAVYFSVELTSTVSFCTSCHEMKAAHDAWKQSKHYNVPAGKKPATCRDCHLPPWTKPVELLWSKAYHGAKDVTRHFTDKEEMEFPGYYFNMKENAGKTLSNASCLKCHADVFGKKYEGYPNIHTGIKNNRNMKCYLCHESTAHKNYLPEAK
jgi:nitrate/TMAO reductase-like tetraheme cytochrome c subunit